MNVKSVKVILFFWVFQSIDAYSMFQEPVLPTNENTIDFKALKIRFDEQNPQAKMLFNGILQTLTETKTFPNSDNDAGDGVTKIYLERTAQPVTMYNVQSNRASQSLTPTRNSDATATSTHIRKKPHTISDADITALSQEFELQSNNGSILLMAAFLHQKNWIDQNELTEVNNAKTVDAKLIHLLGAIVPAIFEAHKQQDVKNFVDQATASLKSKTYLQAAWQFLPLVNNYQHKRIEALQILNNLTTNTTENNLAVTNKANLTKENLSDFITKYSKQDAKYALLGQLWHACDNHNNTWQNKTLIWQIYAINTTFFILWLLAPFTIAMYTQQSSKTTTNIYHYDNNWHPSTNDYTYDGLQITKLNETLKILLSLYKTLFQTSSKPSYMPAYMPSNQPSNQPSNEPNLQPGVASLLLEPSNQPSYQSVKSNHPTKAPSPKSTTQSSAKPSYKTVKSNHPTKAPSQQPTTQSIFCQKNVYGECASCMRQRDGSCLPLCIKSVTTGRCVCYFSSIVAPQCSVSTCTLNATNGQCSSIPCQSGQC